MLFFSLKDLNRKYIEFNKLIGKVGTMDFEKFKVGIFQSPIGRQDVYDFEAFMKSMNAKLFKTKPVHPNYLHSDVKDVLLDLDKKEMVGYYITTKRDVQRVYDIEKTVEKNKLHWVKDKEFIFNRYVSLLKEEDLELFPKKFRTNEYIELYGYKKMTSKLEKVYKMKPAFIHHLHLGKNEIKPTDHICHIYDLPILKKWMNDRRVKYAHMKTIKGITDDFYIVFDLKEKDWHKIRIKLTTEPPEYVNPYFK